MATLSSFGKAGASDVAVVARGATGVVMALYDSTMADLGGDVLTHETALVDKSTLLLLLLLPADLVPFFFLAGRGMTTSTELVSDHDFVKSTRLDFSDDDDDKISSGVSCVPRPSLAAGFRSVSQLLLLVDIVKSIILVDDELATVVCFFMLPSPPSSFRSWVTCVVAPAAAVTAKFVAVDATGDDADAAATWDDSEPLVSFCVSFGVFGAAVAAAAVLDVVVLDTNKVGADVVFRRRGDTFFSSSSSVFV